MTSEKVIVTGHKVLDDGTVIVLVKNAIAAKNPLVRLSGAQKATKHGSFFLNKGVPLEAALDAYPRGARVADAQWGEERDSDFGSIYEVVWTDGTADDKSATNGSMSMSTTPATDTTKTEESKVDEAALADKE